LLDEKACSAVTWVVFEHVFFDKLRKIGNVGHDILEKKNILWHLVS